MSTTARVSIIPQPARLKVRDGVLSLHRQTRIILSKGTAELRSISDQLANRLRVATGYPFPISVDEKREDADDAIALIVDESGNDLGTEGYTLEVKEHSIVIRGRAPAGVFYGVESLYQLLPVQIERNEPSKETQWTIPRVSIEDKPRFSWRGMHLDVGRHFAPKEFIEKYIDLLASYKMNIFHWHLTEDQGWRIEIKRYPRLTEVGSVRRETMNDCTPYGGFYTQDDVREIVEYARQRFITIVPEIEMPGHSQAALAAYPELSCSGGPHTVATEWGVFNDVFCAGNEKTFEFLRNVLTEVIALFPGPFVHIGGDECPKVRWENCVKCQARMKQEGLKDESELQSYFIRRIEKFLTSKGKRLVGWDEILEGGIAPTATVMSWRGTEGGIAAAKAGHDVVMTPTSHCYFDYYQGLPASEPRAIGGYLPLDTVYAFEPTPDELSDNEAKHVLGAQGNVWTEWMPTTQQIEYMVLPRLLAMSEVVWSKKVGRNYDDFLKRLERHYDRFVARGLNFRVPTPIGIGGKKITFHETDVPIQSPISTATIYYTLDGHDPTLSSPVYTKPIHIDRDTTLKAMLTLTNGKQSPTVTTNCFLVDKNTNGLRFRYFEGEWDSLPRFASLQPLRTGKVYDIGLDDMPHRDENYAVQFIGDINVPQEGEYTFYLGSDDGSRLFIDSQEVINNDGLHGMHEERGKLLITKGKHTFEIQFFQRGSESGLDLAIEGGGMARQPVPPKMFVYLP